VIGLLATPDGLLVFLADRVCVVLGGPETTTFYVTDLMTNFGVSNPHAIFRNGSVIGQFNTQSEYWQLTSEGNPEIGHNVADYLQEINSRRLTSIPKPGVRRDPARSSLRTYCQES
jgi:hypothetical protein